MNKQEKLDLLELAGKIQKIKNNNEEFIVIKTSEIKASNENLKEKVKSLWADVEKSKQTIKPIEWKL
jgi:hypothetical protein